MPEGTQQDGTGLAAKAGSVMPWLRAVVGVACLAALVGLVLVPLVGQLALRYFERWTGDARTQYLSDRPLTQHPRIALVTITDETLKDYASSPVDRGLLARIVRAIDSGGARAIGLDILFFKKTEDGKDQALIEALKTAKADIVLGALDERGEIQSFQREFQSGFLATVGRSAGYLNLRHERDDVVRNSAGPYPGGQFLKSFVRLLAAAGGSDQPDVVRAIPWMLPPADGTTNFLTIPAHHLLAGGPEAASKLKDRIVLIGGDFPLRDRHRTPLASAADSDVAGVEIHAQMVAGLLEPKRAIGELDPLQTKLLLVGLAVIGFLIGWRMWESPILHLLGWTSATAVLIAIDAAVFVQWRLSLPITLALLAWVLGVTAGRSLRAPKEKIVARRQKT